MVGAPGMSSLGTGIQNARNSNVFMRVPKTYHQDRINKVKNFLLGKRSSKVDKEFSFKKYQKRLIGAGVGLAAAELSNIKSYKKSRDLKKTHKTLLGKYDSSYTISERIEEIESIVGKDIDKKLKKSKRIYDLLWRGDLTETELDPKYNKLYFKWMSTESKKDEDNFYKYEKQLDEKLRKGIRVLTKKLSNIIEKSKYSYEYSTLLSQKKKVDSVESDISVEKMTRNVKRVGSTGVGYLASKAFK